MAKAGSRPGATNKKKGPTKGTGGHGRKALEGRGNTPKAEDRVYHKAYKMKEAAENRKATDTLRARGPRLAASGPPTNWSPAVTPYLRPCRPRFPPRPSSSCPASRSMTASATS